MMDSTKRKEMKQAFIKFASIMMKIMTLEKAFGSEQPRISGKEERGIESHTVNMTVRDTFNMKQYYSKPSTAQEFICQLTSVEKRNSTSTRKKLLSIRQTLRKWMKIMESNQSKLAKNLWLKMS